MELIEKVAWRFDTTERDELTAELARTLLQLKAGLGRDVRNWKAYLAKALLNRANTWVDNQRRQRRLVPILEPDDNPSTPSISEEDLPAHVQPPDLPAAFAQLWRELDPELRRLWQLLLEEEGNQVAVAKRLGKHRNTVRLWVGRIHEALKRHGFPGPI